MTYNWTKAAENTGPPSMSEGWYLAKVAKLIYEKRDGTRLSTEKGGEYFMLVAENEHGEQGTLSLWPTEKAAWKIAQTLSTLGVGMDELERAGIKPEDFGDPQTASDWFIGREGWVSVTQKGKYANLDFHHEEDVPTSVLQARKERQSGNTPAPRQTTKADYQSLGDDEIPF